MSKSKYAGTAIISECGTYRSELTRDGLIPGNDRPLVDCGLNPSTATSDEDDATIRKGIHYAIAWGCGRLIKINAYDYRSTDPRSMFQAKRQGIDIIGPLNLDVIRRNVALARAMNGIILVSWGGNIEPYRQEQLAPEFGADARCVKVNSDKWRTPMHYLYAKNDVQLIPWRRA